MKKIVLFSLLCSLPATAMRTIGSFVTQTRALSRSATNSFCAHPHHQTIFDATQAGCLDGIHAALAQGADINAHFHRNGWTALHYAAALNRVEVAQFLIERGARIDEQNNNGQTPLHLAVIDGHHTMTKLLLDHDADMNIKDTYLNQTSREVAQKWQAGGFWRDEDGNIWNQDGDRFDHYAGFDVYELIEKTAVAQEAEDLRCRLRSTIKGIPTPE